MNKKISGIILAVVAAMAIIIVAMVVIFGNTSKKYDKQIDLGTQFISEMKWDEAIACFEEAIAIDEKRADAYIGLADAYVGLEELDTAISRLEEAISAFKNRGLDTTILKDKLEKVKKIVEEKEAEKKAQEELEYVENLPYIDLNPIIDVLETFHGKSWLDWTADGLIGEFGLIQDYQNEIGYPVYYDFPYDHSTGKTPDRYVTLEEQDGMNYYLTICSKYYDMDYAWSGVLVFNQDDNHNTYFGQNISSTRSEIVDDYLVPVFREKGVEDLQSLINHIGIEKGYSGPVNTSKGLAQITVEDNRVVLGKFSDYESLEIGFNEYLDDGQKEFVIYAIGR